MTDRNRELIPAEEWYSKHSGVCRRAELPGRSVKVKTF